MLDYKDVSFSFRKRQARRRRLLLTLLLLLVFTGAVTLGIRWWKAKSAVARIEELLLADRLDEAGERLRSAQSRFFQRENFLELRALEELLRGQTAAAAARFADLRRSEAATSLPAGRLLAHLFDRGEISSLRIYSDYLLPRGSDDARWHHALSRAAYLDPEGAAEAVARLSPSFQEENAKALGLLARFNRSLRTGRLDYVFDRNDAPLAYYDIGRRVTRSLVAGIEFSAFDAQFRNGARFFRLSLDSALQEKIDRLFRKYFGTLVVLALPDNGIVAAYSKSKTSGAANAAFSESFAPGSIVKIVTLLAYLRQGNDKLFPMSCPGSAMVAGRIFYDLAPHNLVRDPSQALALSCNVAFARMGEAVGAVAMSDLLQRFFFNAPTFSDRICKFPAGRFARDAMSDSGLAELAVGTGKVSLTTVHAALLASIFAQNGRFFPPYMVDDIKNILDLGFYHHEARPRQLVTDDANFRRVQKAMTAVVTNERGTARRARGRIDAAVKTGTIGNRAGGLDAVIIGFAPVARPSYAFAFRLEGGGRADFDGALFLGELLRTLFPEQG